jgi:hypothetical protein
MPLAANSTLFHRQEVRNTKGIKQTESHKLKGSLSIMFGSIVFGHYAVHLPNVHSVCNTELATHSSLYCSTKWAG